LRKYCSLMKAILTTCICSLILTISLTSCFSLSTTRTTNPTPYTTTTVSQQNRGVYQKPYTTTTRSVTY